MLTDEILLYGGLMIASCAALAAFAAFFIFKMKKMRLDVKLDEEYGKKDERKGGND